MSEPVTPSAEAPTLTCPRHKVATPLTCSTCNTPICPQCYVRTAVGLRCPKCAQGIDVRIGGRRKWPFIVPIVALLAVLAVVVVSSSGSDSGNTAPDSDVEQRADGAARGYKLVSKAKQGFSVEVPENWQAGPDDTDAVLSYSLTRATEGSVRVTVSLTDATVAQTVERLIGQLTPQGGVGFTQTPVQAGGESGIRLSYRMPSSTVPGASIAVYYTTIVKHSGNVLSLQLGTTDPGSNESVFAYIQSSLKFL